MRGRVFASEQQHSAQIHNVLPVQPEFYDGRPAYRRQSNQFSEILISGKMFVPNISTRVKERRFLQCNRVKGGRLDVLEIVAALTGARQIAFCACAAKNFGNDMFSREWIGRIGLLTKINEGLAPADARCMKELIAKRQAYTIQDDELQELIRLTDEAERLNVERLKHLLELAHLRGVTLDEVMDQLHIRPATL